MADNYIENKMAALQQQRPVVRRTNPSLESLLKRNRSYRGYDPRRTVTRKELETIVGATTLIPSGMNRQTLRYRLVTAEEAGQVLPLITLGAALPEEHLPKPGSEPQAFIIACSTAPESRVVDIDLGIAAQTMLLKATEMGLNGIFILNCQPVRLQEALGLPYRPLAVIAIGKGAENIYLKPVTAGEELTYYRKDGVHFVPKLQVEDLIL